MIWITAYDRSLFSELLVYLSLFIYYRPRPSFAHKRLKTTRFPLNSIKDSGFSKTTSASSHFSQDVVCSIKLLLNLLESKRLERASLCAYTYDTFFSFKWSLQRDLFQLQTQCLLHRATLIRFWKRKLPRCYHGKRGITWQRYIKYSMNHLWLDLQESCKQSFFFYPHWLQSGWIVEDLHFVVMFLSSETSHFPTSSRVSIFAAAWVVERR